MSVLKNAFIEWQEGLEKSLKPELPRQEQIQLQMERLNDCINNQFDDEQEPDHEDDGDALASANYGTDEDYGYFGEDSQL